MFKMKYRVLIKFHKNFIETDGNTITIGVMAKPEKGKANEEIIKKIAGYFGVPRSSVKIVSGATSKKKNIEIK